MIEWYMIFTIFMNDTLYTMMTSPMTQFQCEEMLDGQIQVYRDLKVPRHHMTGRCIETLEKKKDNTKPEFAN